MSKKIKKPECHIDKICYGIVNAKECVAEILNNNNQFLDAIEFENRMMMLYKHFYNLIAEYVEIYDDDEKSEIN